MSRRASSPITDARRVRRVNIVLYKRASSLITDARRVRRVNIVLDKLFVSSISSCKSSLCQEGEHYVTKPDRNHPDMQALQRHGGIVTFLIIAPYKYSYLLTYLPATEPPR